MMSSIQREVIFLILTAFSFFVLGSLGAALLSHFCVAGETAIFDANDGLWLQSVGIVGCVIQLAVQILMMFLVLSFGVWIGRRS